MMWTEGRTDMSELCDVDRGMDRRTNLTGLIVNLLFSERTKTEFVPHGKPSKSPLRLRY